MIFGRVSVDERAVSTHRDSYVLSTLTVVSVRRPFLAPSVMLSLGIGGFVMTFSDLLHISEISICIGVAAGLILTGTQLAQLSLLSRDLRGSDLSSAVWGLRASLEIKRQEIVSALRISKKGDAE